jgi:2,4-dienoyl-CoA reductase-like NADH-dependent reductase (Old Yellow Enzyme family)
MGIWEDRHIEPLARIARFIHPMGGVPGVRLAHAGSKVSCRAPREGGARLKLEEGGIQSRKNPRHDKSPSGR